MRRGGHPSTTPQEPPLRPPPVRGGGRRARIRQQQQELDSVTTLNTNTNAPPLLDGLHKGSGLALPCLYLLASESVVTVTEAG